MKKWFLFLLIYNFSFALPIQDRKIDSTALSQLTTTLNIPQDTNIIVETQKRWLRKPNQERWEMEELSPEKKLFVLNWATEQGLFAPWKPTLETYDKALILGATTSRMQMRLDYLKELWNQGTRFSEIVWLTGDRPLDKKVDGLTERCNNESEAAHILWEETTLPEEMRNIPVTFITVPMKAEGKRPNTEDTLIAWLKTTPQPCTALFVSDQPFCGYQFAIIKACMPTSIAFDLVGQGVDPNSHPSSAAITLDSLARWLYVESLMTPKL